MLYRVECWKCCIDINTLRYCSYFNGQGLLGKIKGKAGATWETAECNDVIEEDGKEDTKSSKSCTFAKGTEPK